MGLDILGLDIMGLDILGLDILGMTLLNHVIPKLIIILGGVVSVEANSSHFIDHLPLYVSRCGHGYTTLWHQLIQPFPFASPLLLHY